MAELPIQRKEDRAPAREIHQMVYDAIYDELPNIVAALIARAKGFKMMGEEGEIYLEKPDMKSAEYLINRVMGRPTQVTADLAGMKNAQTFEDMVKLMAEERKAIAEPTVDPRVITVRPVEERLQEPDPAQAVQAAELERRRAIRKLMEQNA